MKSMMFLFIYFLTPVCFSATTEIFKDGSTLSVREVQSQPISFEDLQMFDWISRDQCRLTPERFDLQGLITLGKELWQIVKDGAPVIHFQKEALSVIPANAVCPFLMSNWSLPQSKTFELSYKNKFGMEMVFFSYKLIYSYGGRFENKGAYLANVSIHPKDIRLKWGQTFDAQVKIANALNLGTLEDPVAGLEISLEWDLQNPIMDTKTSRSYFVDGRGQLMAL